MGTRTNRYSYLLVCLALASHAEAQLNGQVAVEIWPASGRFSNEKMVLPDCSAHLVPNHDLDRELIFPCGDFFAPPPGRYLHWIEGIDRISPDHLVLAYAGGPFQGQSLSIVRGTVPAGRVSFAGVPENPDLVVRLLHLDSHFVDDRVFFEFHRRLPAARAKQGAQLPVGNAVAFLFDNAKGEYLALGRPFEVQAGAETRLASPQRPAATAVLAILERPDIVDSRSRDDLAPHLLVGGRRLEPDLRFGDAARVYAVWYEVTGDSARLELTSRNWRIAETIFSLRGGKVEALRPELKPQPQLRVDLQRPSSWLEREARLLLVEPGASSLRPIAELVLGPNDSSAIFTSIPSRPLEVELRVDSYSLREAIDASDGLDHSVIFQPETIELHGRVLVGDQLAAGATITFHLNRLQRLPEARQDRLVVETDAEGRYQATLFAPGWLPITITLPDRESLPFSIFPRLYIEESGPLDFHLPANRFTVEVVDRRSGRGIEGAEVEIESSFGEGSVTSTSDRTRAQGLLDLPPIEAGRLQLRALAPRYAEGSKVVEVSKGIRKSRFRIELSPLADTEEISILLPDGRPAARALAALFASTIDSSPPLWQGAADQEGKLEVPREAEGSALLIQHSGAGGVALPFPYPQALRLPPRAPDLVFHVVDRRGVPSPTTAIAFRLGEVQVAGRALSFLLANPLPATDHQGIFRASGLPLGTVGVWAWAPALQGEALTGQLAGLATQLDPARAQGRIELTRIE